MRNNNGHFSLLRPFWLLVLIPLLSFIVYLALSPQIQTLSNISALLNYICLNKKDFFPLWPFIVGSMMAIFIILALAGPTWEKQAQSGYLSSGAVIIALDLSPSMAAEDIKPSRIERAHLKIKPF